MHIQRIINPSKGVFFLIALFLLLIFNIANAFADSYVIVGSRGIGTKINTLPYTIASSGYYYIARDLSCDATNHGITIAADNVTLDLMGFSLNGPGSGNDYDGIYIDTLYNVEIRNGTVRNFKGCGIHEDSSNGNGHRIINIRANNNSSSGIALVGKNNLIEKCTAESNGSYGISAGYHSTITGNNCLIFGQ